MAGQKQVSVKDIANELHISLSTVHKALTGKPGVGATRRREVLETAERLGYTVNSAAQSLARKAMRLSIVMPQCWQEYFDPIRRGIEKGIDALRESRVEGRFFYLAPEDLENDLKEYLDFVKEYAPDAVLYCPSHHSINQCAAAALSTLQVPIFWVGGGDNNPLGAPSIAIDAERSGYMAADFLACTASTPLRAALFTGSMQNRVHRAKAEAFCDRIAEYSDVPVEILETEDDAERAYAAARTLFERAPATNAVYVSTLASEPICRYMEEQGLAGRVKLLGTDVFDALKDYMRRGVMQATVFQNQQQVGEAAVGFAYEYLHRKSSYGYADWKAKSGLFIEPQLFLRANIE